MYPALLIFFVVMNNVLLNTQINRMKSSLEDDLSMFLKARVQIGKILYILPAYIVIQDLRLIDEHGGVPHVIFSADKLRSQFTVKKGQAALSYARIDGVYFDKEYLTAFLQEHQTALLQYLSQIKSADIQLQLANGTAITVDQKTHQQTAWQYEGEFNVASSNLFARGVCREVDPFTAEKKPPLEFQLNGKFIGKQLSISQLKVGQDHFYISFWGEMYQNVAQLKGYTFVGNNLSSVFHHADPQAGFSRDAVGSLNVPAGTINQDPAVNYYILDIDTRLEFTAQALEVKYLGLMLNHDPLRLKGKLTWEDHLKFDLNGYYQMDDWAGRNKNIVKLDLGLSGSYQNQRISASGNVGVDMPQVGGEVNLRKINFSFDNGWCLLSEFPKMSGQINNPQINYTINDEKQVVSCDHLRWKAYWTKDTWRKVEFLFPYNLGTVHGRMWVGVNQPLPKVIAYFLVKNVGLDYMDLKENKNQIRGRVNGSVSLKLNPQFSVKSRMSLEQGNFSHMPVLDQISEALAMPSLKDLDFEKLSSEISWDLRQWHFKRIALSNAQVTLRGDVDIKSANMLNSHFTVSLSRQLVKNSRKFRRLLAMVDKKVDPLTLDFALAGTFNSLNIQWLESDLKKSIERRLPIFIENFIQDRIEESLQRTSLRIK